jgi:hypothetical protein
MAIERQNILQLLGKSRNKYHSCIITSYSFSFQYFEKRILPILRGAGIVNINLLVDTNMLAKQLEINDNSKIHEPRKSYSITPISIPGAFHPKLLLAIGKEKGMLAIGSGNLTGAGMNYNEEVWGAYHYHENDTTAIGLFQEVIMYLKEFGTFIKGINQEKISWIGLNSDWYANLEKISSLPKSTQFGKENVQLIKSGFNISIYRQLLDILPQNPKAIKVLSPFYNEDGRFISNLWKDLRPDSIHCIVDPQRGTIPSLIDKSLPFNFSNWNILSENSENNSSILHAKAMQFEYPKESYFLFGSPNATMEAFGSKTTQGTNAELAILMRSNSHRDYFQELGIEFPKKGNLTLDSVKGASANDEDNQTSQKYRIHIDHAEILDNELTIFLKPSSKDIYGSITLYNTDGLEVSKSEPQLLQAKINLNIDAGIFETLYKIAVLDINVRISNFALIHKVEILAQTNPDIRFSMLNDVLTRQGAILDSFLILITEFDWNDILSSPEQSYKRKSLNIFTKDDEHPSAIKTTKLTEEQFNSSVSDEKYRPRGAEGFLNLLEKSLRTLPFKSRNISEEIRDSSERISESNEEEGLDESDFCRLSGHGGN